MGWRYATTNVNLASVYAADPKVNKSVQTKRGVYEKSRSGFLVVAMAGCPVNAVGDAWLTILCNKSSENQTI